VQGRAEQARLSERAEKDSHLNPWWKPSADKQSARPGLKSKISNSGPLTASKNGSTANIGALPQSPKSEKKKRRRDSDASFWCQGVESVVLDRYQVGELESDDEKEMLPQQLFKGKGKEMSGRDTKVYQPYVEVLREYWERR
jgi:hypothetical protein